MIRWLSAGESHGPKLTGIIDGVPAGIAYTQADLEAELHRRKKGYGRGARQKIETDRVTITSGIRHGVTTGAPIAIEISNSEWDKWAAVLATDPVDPVLLRKAVGGSDDKELARNRKLTRPRPGHADMAGMLKYGHVDARNILERASARETAMRVALGSIAKAFLYQVAGIQIVSHVTAIAEISTLASQPGAAEFETIEASEVRTADKKTEQLFKARIDAAKQAGDTVGGSVEVIAFNVPVGLGSHIQWDRRLDAKLAAAMMSIQSAKQVTIGVGDSQIEAGGQQAHDEFAIENSHVTRSSNLAGGIEGGMSNGQPVVVQVGFKPISTVPRARQSFDLESGRLAPALHQRSDTCAVVPAAVVAEAMLALVLADEVTGMFGTGSLEMVKRNLVAFQAEIQQRLFTEGVL
ncbi:chorismate synthase [Gleimia coleocanis DSM 15436]|uniref:Chorismate synthase n=1 Tax=Gleimia coleocanis DSM 15436 TaxID=525245 RepID=C0W1M3_9ACTO|nr:chorismate synthase [Gleimia coleocanis]EEH63389.1 chorismate synthase [Gleimia coleocanis DSM 15436]